jgi:hypothetical protein
MDNRKINMGILRQIFGHELEELQDQDIAVDLTTKLLNMLNHPAYSMNAFIKHLNRLFDEWSYRDDDVYMASCVLTDLIYREPELERDLFQ